MKKTTVLIITGAFLTNPGIWGTGSFLKISEVFFNPNPSVSQSDEIACTNCHDKIVAGLVLHYPVSEGCTNCHNEPEANHPENPQRKVTLADKTPDLCYVCHDTKNTHKYIHSPIESGECLNCHAVHSSNTASLLTEATIAAQCNLCHETGTSIDKPNKHAPISDGDCTVCHDPHESDNAQLIKSTKPGLCFDCHSDIGEMVIFPTVHAPFADDCSNCHSPHESLNPALLTEKTIDLCYTCHEPYENMKSSHEPVKNGDCVTCHSPHASKESKLLLNNSQTLCLNCHSKTITTDSVTIKNIGKQLSSSALIHGAVELDGCTTCHDAHGSNNQMLLKNTFPADTYVHVEAGSFALCFDCHDGQMLKEGIVPLLTNFRDGSRNLHCVHIHGAKGRNCTLCHEMHASNNKHLIAKTVIFGNWEMPLNYVASISGGSCETGCHSKKSYVNNIY